MAKADVLFLLIGTNPVPNIISVLNRVKTDGVVYFFHTKGSVGDGTEDIAKKLKEVVSKKINGLKVCLEAISSTDDFEINKKLLEITDKVINSVDIIELNYTGGTKVMAATAYHNFVELAKSNNNKIINLTYLDNERNLLIIEAFHKGELKVSQILLSEMSINNMISIQEIAEIHCVGINFDEPKIINQWACEIVFNKVKDKTTSKETIAQLDDYNTKIKANKVTSQSKLDVLKQTVDPFEEIYNILDVPHEFNKLGFDSEYKEIKALEYFCGFWLEYYVLNILIKNKNNWGITEIVHSVKNDKDTEKEKKFEVDIVFLKNNTTYFLSVSTVDYLEKVLNKLYEITYRATQLAGDSGKIGLISLYSSSVEVEKNYMKFWEEERQKNYMIVQLDKLEVLEKEIFKWIN